MRNIYSINSLDLFHVEHKIIQRFVSRETFAFRNVYNAFNRKTRRKYKIITYESIYNYFDNIKEQINDNYIKDFLSALKTLKKEFNNELEEDMKYRFYHTIGKI